MQAGRADSLAAAYELARKLEGLPPAPDGAEAQRLAAQRAKAARTPRTASVAVPALDEDESMSQKELLGKLMRERSGTGGARRL